MGNSNSFQKKVSEVQSYIVTLPTNAKAWTLLYSGSLEEWTKSAGQYGLDVYPHSCINSNCDRVAVCLQYLKADLNRRKKTIIIKRWNKKEVCVPYSSNNTFKLLVDKDGYHINEAALASRESLALLVCNYSSELLWLASFPLLDLDTKEIKCILTAPVKNMTILQAEISPDLSKTAIVFYYSKNSATQTFCYELFLYSNETGETLDCLPLTDNIDPHIAFDPRCDWSRMAVLGYGMCSDNQENDMVILSTSERKVLKKCKLSPTQTFSRGHFNILYSKDGYLLILQKLTSGRFSDTYIFDSDELILLKYLTATLPGLLRTCAVSYQPVFSNCGSYMRLVSHKCQGNQSEEVVRVYQLPRILNLQFQSRIVVLRNIHCIKDIDKLALPSKLVNYLKFKPTEI